ncbi:MAG: CHC2 zinc finger domain-containing protein [Acidobacteria bacterium]|nr:CHC2 zinc finger domain-containing protein [Acidobacteriota bacterium]
MTATVTVDIAALKAHHPLGDVVEASGVKLRGRGRVRQGKCPFHEETEGSFTVYADTQRFYCFGCGLGGDVLDFIQRTDGVDLPEALRRLERAPPPQDQAAAPATRQPASAGPLPAVRDPALLTAAMRCYQRQLQLSEAAQAYLAGRGIGPQAAQRLGLGYVSGHGLRDWLRQAGFDDQRILGSGLVREQRERFQGMIVVPDLCQGRVHWLAGRSIWPEVSPRFQALPGPKPVLGLQRLDGQAPWIVVAEGLFDWLVLSAWGLPACAALGTPGVGEVASSPHGRPRRLLAGPRSRRGER